MAVQARTGLAADFDKSQLLAGELAYVSDAKQGYLGDGAGGATKIGDMFAGDYANGSGVASTKPVDKALAVTRSYANLPAGFSTIYHGATAPDHTLFEQGQLASRTIFADLWAFAQISGNLVTDADWLAGKRGSFSSGDGSTTFRIPDMRGVAAIGAGTAASGTTYEFGSTGGEEKHILTIAEIAKHVHKMYTTSVTSTVYPPGGNGYLVYNKGTGDDSGSVGGDAAHNNMQPWAAVNYVIVY